MKDLEISFWFKLTQFESESDLSEAKLLRLTGSCGQSLSVQMIDPYVIQLHCVNSTGQQQTIRSNRAMGADVMHLNVWYNFRLVFTHARTFSLFSSDELTINIDSSQRICIKESFKFPDFFKSDDLFSVTIGENLSGELSTIYIFSEALADDVAKPIATLAAGKTTQKFGVEFISNIDVKCLTSRTPESDSIAINIGSTSSLLSMGHADTQKMNAALAKLVVALHPGRVHRNVAIDVHSKYHAVLSNHTYAWSSRSPRDQLRSIGGCAFIYQLFALSIEIKKRVDDASAHEVQVLALLFDVIAAFVPSNKANTDDFRKREASLVIAQILCLETPEIKHVIASETATTLVSLIALREAFRYSGEYDMENAVVRDIITNFTIWQHASEIFQLSLANYVSQDICQNTQKYVFQYCIATKWLLETIDMHYSGEGGSNEHKKRLRQFLYDALRSLLIAEKGKY